ncbi:YppF family protein [Bacillus tuaregi]|uniref:YppF family protein n=1 Tax=Bacillus tuaregi TaxID=1816695 RepID=UPI0008F9746F|nr:YppF family protein [Bacillus tuaregi]
MTIENLIYQFKEEKNFNPSHANDLLDYIQKCYIEEKLSISEYKKLFCELDKMQAEKPLSYFIKTCPYERINLPG